MFFCELRSSSKKVTSTFLLLLLAASGVYCNISSNCPEKDVIKVYLDTAENSISNAMHILPSADCSLHCNATSNCSEKIVSAHLDIAADMVAKIKHINLRGNDCTQCQKSKPVDCADVLFMGHNESGIYEIWPNNRLTENKSLVVFCDMATNGGGWTVIQRRGDFGSPKDYFFKEWSSYREGFGNVEKDFWLGNDNIFALTSQKLYSVVFDLKDSYQNERYALYDDFWIDDESHSYTLHISSYSGNAGNAMARHDNKPFAAKDRDNTTWAGGEKCTERFKGAWWYASCHDANLNGLYYKGRHTDGVTWNKWKVDYETLEWTEIKIRPKYLKDAFTPGMY